MQPVCPNLLAGFYVKAVDSQCALKVCESVSLLRIWEKSLVKLTNPDLLVSGSFSVWLNVHEVLELFICLCFLSSLILF